MYNEYTKKNHVHITVVDWLKGGIYMHVKNTQFTLFQSSFFLFFLTIENKFNLVVPSFPFGGYKTKPKNTPLD